MRRFPQDKLRAWAAVIDGPTATFIMVAVTIYSLYVSDIVVATLPRSADDWMVPTIYALIALFLVELVVRSAVIPGYFGRFFWFLDVLAWLSLLLQLPFALALEDSNESNLLLAKAGRAGKSIRLIRQTGKSARFLRVLRLLQLVRIFKFVSTFRRTHARGEGGEEAAAAAAASSSTAADRASAEAVRSGSLLGRHMAELASRRVIVLFMLLMLTMPYLEYDESCADQAFGLEYLALATEAQPAASLALNDSNVQLFLAFFPNTVRLKVHGQTLVDEQDVIAQLRAQEQRLLVLPDKAEVLLSLVEQVRLEAVVNIVFTTLMVVLLIGTSLVFARDSKRLIVAPIERMLGSIRDIHSIISGITTATPRSSMETGFVEQSIAKMTALVRVLSMLDNDGRDKELLLHDERGSPGLGGGGGSGVHGRRRSAGVLRMPETPVFTSSGHVVDTRRRGLSGGAVAAASGLSATVSGRRSPVVVMEEKPEMIREESLIELARRSPSPFALE
eukprot:PLAT9054.1.p1 GENE.PLAT9054.1~~PLAT9054.1.p1  ORF type:complete len:504 (+),score=281.77 PLAT9054.1:304-1815(+)